MAVSFYLNYSGNSIAVDESLAQLLMLIAPIAIISGLGMSFIVVKKRLPAIKEITNLKEKLDAYRALMITKYAILEFPSFFALVCYLLTGHYLFISLAGLMLVVFFINKPSVQKATEELELNASDSAILADPHSII